MNKTDKTVCEQLKPYQFVKGQSGNPAGRPKGSISVMDSIRHIFENEPERFVEFVDKYLRDPRNRQHIVEMIDGKPKGSAPETNVNLVIPILGGTSVQIDNSNPEVAQIEEAN